MTERKLCSVITPTWQRPDLLIETMGNVREQTYRPLEHVIVSDGVDAGLRLRVAHTAMSHNGGPCFVPVRWVELGRNWSSFLPDSFCAAPTTVGMLLASGEYQTWCTDDERMEPDHIESLVDALEAGGADFAYSRVRMHWHFNPPAMGWEIGADPPQLGQITNALYRADLLKRGLYPFGAGMVSDWACIHRWMAAGATWAYVPRVTLTHRVDH